MGSTQPEPVERALAKRENSCLQRQGDREAWGALGEDGDEDQEAHSGGARRCVVNGSLRFLREGGPL